MCVSIGFCWTGLCSSFLREKKFILWCSFECNYDKSCSLTFFFRFSLSSIAVVGKRNLQKQSKLIRERWKLLYKGYFRLLFVEFCVDFPPMFLHVSCSIVLFSVFVSFLPHFFVLIHICSFFPLFFAIFKNSKIQYICKYIYIGNSENLSAQGEIYHRLGAVYLSALKYDDAVEAEEKYLEIARRRRDEEAEANAFGALTRIYEESGNIDKAIESVEEFRRLAEAAQNETIVANAYFSLGHLYTRLVCTFICVLSLSHFESLNQVRISFRHQICLFFVVLLE